MQRRLATKVVFEMEEASQQQHKAGKMFRKVKEICAEIPANITTVKTDMGN